MLFCPFNPNQCEWHLSMLQAAQEQVMEGDPEWTVKNVELHKCQLQVPHPVLKY